jgi:8-oxo-dGTP pyrophosphatase MutT (NUDIX family)
MRMAATDLGLPALGQQQIRTLLWEARNGDAGPVQPLTPDQPLSLAPTPWLLELVAGIIDPGEVAEEVVRREAVEEAGE